MNSYTGMKAKVDKMHPREVYTTEDGKQKKRPRPVCRTRTGSFSCCHSWRRSDLAEYGEGIVSYFQLLKYMSILYFVAAVVSIPTMLFYSSGNSEFSQLNILEPESLIQWLSLAALGDSNIACGSGVFDTTPKEDGSSQGFTAQIPIQCQYGELESILDFGQLPAS